MWRLIELRGGTALQLQLVCSMLLGTTRPALASPDIIDSSTSPAPLSSAMSQVALPRCSTTTSPGTSRRDDKAMMRPTHTNGTTHCWSRTLQLSYRTVCITFSFFSLHLCRSLLTHSDCYSGQDSSRLGHAGAQALSMSQAISLCRTAAMISTACACVCGADILQ